MPRTYARAWDECAENLTRALAVAQKVATQPGIDDTLLLDADREGRIRYWLGDRPEEIDINALNAEIARIVARQAELRTAIDAIVADLEGDS